MRISDLSSDVCSSDLGSGSIATVMLLMSRAEGLSERLVVIGAVVVTLVLMLASLLAAGPIMALLGAKIEAVITRLLGVLLAALAAQFVIDGLKASVQSAPRSSGAGRSPVDTSEPPRRNKLHPPGAPGP